MSKPTPPKANVQAAPKAAQSGAKAAVRPNAPAKPSKRPSILPWLGLSIIWILLDQLTKLWVVARLDLGAVVEVTSFFNLVHVLNPGAAFSFLASQEGWQRHFLSGVAVVASIVILFMMRSSSHRKLAMLCLASILGGALGNLLDRSMHGAVIDFLDFYWGNYHWPAFNVADMAISMGAIGLIIDELWFNQADKTKGA